jgi:CDP-diacylglycerol--glycerol-3-phosphate 3-phosphatidyltransferase
MKSKSNLNLPNLLTMFRFAIIPAMMVMLTSRDVLINFFAAFLFLLASLTDIMDGYIARKYNIVTNLGKILDPLADKLIVLIALVMLIPLGRAPAWIVALIVLRETAVTSLRAVAATEGVVIAASPLGKYKNLFQVIATLFLIMYHNFPLIKIGGVPISLDFHTSGILVLWVALILTLWSGLDYFVKFFHVSVKS